MYKAVLGTAVFFSSFLTITSEKSEHKTFDPRQVYPDKAFIGAYQSEFSKRFYLSQCSVTISDASNSFFPKLPDRFTKEPHSCNELENELKKWRYLPAYGGQNKNITLHFSNPTEDKLSDLSLHNAVLWLQHAKKVAREKA